MSTHIIGFLQEIRKKCQFLDKKSWLDKLILIIKFYLSVGKL